MSVSGGSSGSESASWVPRRPSTMSSSSRCALETAGSHGVLVCQRRVTKPRVDILEHLRLELARRDAGCTQEIASVLAPTSPGRRGSRRTSSPATVAPRAQSGRTASSAPRARASTAVPGRRGRPARRRSRVIAVHQYDRRLGVERRCPEGEGDAVARVLPDPLLRREHAGEKRRRLGAQRCERRVFLPAGSERRRAAPVGLERRQNPIVERIQRCALPVPAWVVVGPRKQVVLHACRNAEGLTSRVAADVPLRCIPRTKTPRLIRRA